MRITLFGYLWIILLLYAAFMKQSKYIITVFFVGMVLQSTNVLYVGDVGVGPQLITSIVLTMYALLHSELVTRKGWITLSRGNKIRHRAELFCTLLIIAIFVSVKANYSLYENNKQIIIYSLIAIVIYALCFFSCWSVGKKISNEDLQFSVNLVIWFVAIMGVIQILTTSNILPRITFVSTLFYNDTSTNVVYNQSNYRRICSTFMEPSYSAPFLVGSFFYLITKKKIFTWNTIVLSMLIALEIILTFSSTAYGALLIVGVIYLVIENKKKALKYLIPFAMIVVFLLTITGQLMPILDKVIFTKTMTGSYATRNRWNLECLEAFRSSWIIGVGYKQVRGSSLFYSIIGQLGLVGLCTFGGLNLVLFIEGFNRNNNFHYNGCFIYFLISTLVCMIIAIPDIDFCVYWLMLDLMALSFSAKDAREDYMNDYFATIQNGRNG